MPPDPSSPDDAAAPILREARYSLTELQHEVEHERRHSILGLELVDQGEIGAIFKSRPQRSRAKGGQN